MDERARDILTFWLDEGGPSAWYRQDAAYDALIRERYAGLWREAAAGGLDGWQTRSKCCLALLILLDQFPRNMFRGSGEAFSSDWKALSVAKSAIAQGLDGFVDMPAKQFFYLPLMHSEILSDQSRAVHLFLLNVGQGASLDHARAHRAIIRRFSRFPYRNEVLGRTTSDVEQAFLDAGGYSAAMAEVGG
jgi:uncharacterized protein (DUF924 family)